MNNRRLRVLVVGGYGGFGKRLVGLLDGLELDRIFVAGRSFAAAEAFCAQAGGVCTPVRFDRTSVDRKHLEELDPHIVVDAAGPFQCYGPAPYELVEACLSSGINYLDLADGREFVCNINHFDDEARRRGVFVLSGASSVPALSGAAIREIARRFQQLERIEIGISPAGGVVMGRSVVRAILSYAGQPVPVLEDGNWCTKYCWTDLKPEQLRTTGGNSLNPRRFSLCDVPDLALWPQLYPELRFIHFGAAVEPAVNHLGLFLLAWLVRLRILPSAQFLSAPLHRLVQWMPSGVRRGGMFVRVTGRDDTGDRGTAEWTLIAEGDDGPNIPSMAAAALIGKVSSGAPPSPGARACTSDLELADFSPYFSRFRIETSLR